MKNKQVDFLISYSKGQTLSLLTDIVNTPKFSLLQIVKENETDIIYYTIDKNKEEQNNA